MTEKEKAIAYDKAIERAKKLYGNEIAEEIFPELKESEDEMIKKAIIEFFESEDDNTTYSLVRKKDIIDWLKKQGKNSTDKTPRFNVGDWVIYIKYKSIYQVEKKENYEYTLRYILGGSLCLPFSNEELIREWTIQDAKDGDVLACNEEILLFKSYSVMQGRISLYCWYNRHTNNFHSKDVIDTLLTTMNKVCPATKEQRDTLMKAMNDAGYEWDVEKKELKKLSNYDKKNATV